MDNCNTHKIFKGIYREEAMKKKIDPTREKRKQKYRTKNKVAKNGEEKEHTRKSKERENNKSGKRK